MKNQASTAFAEHEVSLKGKLTKVDGSVHEFEGDTVAIELPEELVKEYKALTKRMREIETELIKIMTGA